MKYGGSEPDPVLKLNFYNKQEVDQTLIRLR